MNNFEKSKNFCEENQDTNNIAAPKSKSKKTSKKRKKYKGGFFASVADAIARGLKNGFLGFVFADLYTNLNRKWKNGAIYRLFHRKKNQVRSKAKIATLYEESFTRRVFSYLSHLLLQTYVRALGLGVFTFAFSVIFAAMLKYATSEEGFTVNIQPTVILGIIMALCSLPLLISKKRLGEALLKGKISGFIVNQILSIDETKLAPDENSQGGSYVVSFEIALFLGFLTYFISPMNLIGIGLFVLAFVVIMSFPELGIMTIMAIIPFVNVIKNPSLALLFLIIFTVLAFLFKFVRGKRIMRFELVDLGVLLFGILIFFGGVFTKGGASSTASAFLYCGFLSIYFLIVNSYIRKTWIYRGIKLMIVTTALIALLGVIEGGVLDYAQLDLSQFDDIHARVSSFLGNPNMLGAYLVIVFPFALAQMLSTDKGIKKGFYFLCVLSIFVCTVLTWSRGAWLGLIVSVVVFLLVSDFRSVWFILLGCGSVPLALYLVPENISNRFISIFTMSDSSITYRFETWDGVLKMIEKYFWTGIGIGESAFISVYPEFAVSGTETVMHAHNIFLQILLEIGIIGLVVFLVTAFMFTQKCFAGVKERRRGGKSRNMISAGLASVCATFVMGLTDHVFYNYRVFLVFWIFVGLTVAMTKINEKEKFKADEAARVNGSSRSVDIDIFVSN